MIFKNYKPTVSFVRTYDALPSTQIGSRNASDVGWLMQTNPSLKRTRYSNTESFAD
jgi:hypothetical protein